MKTSLILPAVLLACLGFAPGAPVALVTTAVSGDYVEARTASVFAGACHFNGELVTTGNDAIMAWSISGGTWKGVDLTGVRAMAAVTCDTNLRDDAAPRKSELLVDAKSSDQVVAISEMLRSKVGAMLGTVTAVRHGPIVFSHPDKSYAVSAAHFGSLAVDALPNNECCAQPNLVWYTPLTPLEHRKVGYTQSATYTGETLTDSWEREGENSAFYGRFSF